MLQVASSLQSELEDAIAAGCKYPGAMIGGDEGRFGNPCQEAEEEETGPEPLFVARIPPGATSVAHDRINRRFVVSFNGACVSVCTRTCLCACVHRRACSSCNSV